MKIISIINDHPNEIEIIAIGPLTNIAKVFISNPSIIKKIKTLYIMGGIGEGKGNITEYAEFNFWVDPDAADVVLNSNIEIKMIAWDTTQIYGYLDKDNFDESILEFISQFLRYILFVEDSLYSLLFGISLAESNFLN